MKKKEKEWSYKTAHTTISNAKAQIYTIMGIFFLVALIGFFIPTPEQIATKILEVIKNLLEQTKDMSQGELIWFIFLNNLKTSAMGFIFGIAFGVFPIILTITNGFLVGFVSKISVQEEGLTSLWRLLPHGIFELPAVFISLGLGLKLGTFLFRKQEHRQFKTFKKELFETARAFILIVIPLLLIAAIIEGTLISLAN